VPSLLLEKRKEAQAGLQIVGIEEQGGPQGPFSVVILLQPDVQQPETVVQIGVIGVFRRIFLNVVKKGTAEVTVALRQAEDQLHDVLEIGSNVHMPGYFPFHVVQERHGAEKGPEVIQRPGMISRRPQGGAQGGYGLGEPPVFRLHLSDFVDYLHRPPEIGTAYPGQGQIDHRIDVPRGHR